MEKEEEERSAARNGRDLRPRVVPRVRTKDAARRRGGKRVISSFSLDFHLLLFFFLAIHFLRLFNSVQCRPPLSSEKPKNHTRTRTTLTVLCPRRLPKEFLRSATTETRGVKGTRLKDRTTAATLSGRGGEGGGEEKAGEISRGT